MARVQHGDKRLEVGVVLHADAEIAHRCNCRVVSRKVVVGELLLLIARGLDAGIDRKLRKHRHAIALRTIGCAGGVAVRRGFPFRFGLALPCQKGRQVPRREVAERLHLEQLGIDAEEIPRDRLCHILKIASGKPELLELVEGELLKPLRALRGLPRAQERVEFAENVLSERALLKIARQIPRLLQRINRLWARIAGSSRCLFEGGQIQMHAEHGVALCARVFGAKQIIDIAPVSTFTTALLVSVLQHGPTSIRKSRCARASQFLCLTSYIRLREANLAPSDGIPTILYTDERKREESSAACRGSYHSAMRQPSLFAVLARGRSGVTATGFLAAPRSVRSEWWSP